MSWGVDIWLKKVFSMPFTMEPTKEFSPFFQDFWMKIDFCIIGAPDRAGPQHAHACGAFSFYGTHATSNLLCGIVSPDKNLTAVQT